MSFKKILFWIAILAFSVFVPVQLFNYAVGSYKCGAQWSASGLEYKYHYRAGCLVKMGKAWVPEGNVRFGDDS